MSIYSLLPDAEVLLALQPEELAGFVLEYFGSLHGQTQTSQMQRGNFGLRYTVQEYPEKYQIEILRALMEAWSWLEREGLIAEKPEAEASNRHYFVTRRGARIKNKADLAAYRHMDMLRKEMLHPAIEEKVRPNFLRGDYDTAVFQAFKEVEVGIRDGLRAANITFKGKDFGNDLIRQAFNYESGALTDMNLHSNERRGRMELFCGAYALYRNPTAHRYGIEDPTEAVELIMLASHLRKIVDARIEAITAIKEGNT